MSGDACIDRVRRTLVEEVTELRWAGQLAAEDIPRQAAPTVAEILGVPSPTLLPTAAWAQRLLSRQYIVPPQPPAGHPPNFAGHRCDGRRGSSAGQGQTTKARRGG